MPRSLVRAAVAALVVAASTASAQVAPALSLAEQMRAMLGTPATGTAAPAGTPTAPTTAATPTPAPAFGTMTAAPLAVGSAPLVVNGPVQLRQSATELALRFPAQHRAAMTKAYEESFSFWQKLEGQLGLVPNDVGAAVAAFIAGNYAAFMQRQVPDADFKALVSQMQGLLSRNAAFMQSPPATKRAMYEQLAMVGTFMAVYREHLQNKPDAQQEVNFRNAAKANLEAGLGLAIERVQIGPQGLVAR